MSFTRHQQCNVEDTSNKYDVTKIPLGFVKYQGEISF